jgi:hypothetical protein
MAYLAAPMTVVPREPLWSFPGMSIDTFPPTNSAVARFGTGGSIMTYPSANTAIYVPIRIRRPTKAVKLWWSCETTGTDNVDIGIYDRNGTRLVSTGAVAKLASSNPLIVNTTDTGLKPGLHYVAVNCAAATATFRAISLSVPNLAAAGVRTEAVGAVTLPATATWVVNQTLAFLPIAGMMLDPTVA